MDTRTHFFWLISVIIIAAAVMGLASWRYFLEQDEYSGSLNAQSHKRVSTAPVGPRHTFAYSNSEYGFNMKYDDIFILQDYTRVDADKIYQPQECAGKSFLACIYLSGSFVSSVFSNTNLEGAGIVVSVIPTARTESACLVRNRQKLTVKREVGESAWYGISGPNITVAAEKVAWELPWRHFYNNACFEVVQRINYGNFLNFDASVVKEFNQDLIIVELDKLFDSWRFAS